VANHILAYLYEERDDIDSEKYEVAACPSSQN
jgi:hypothetical protein